MASVSAIEVVHTARPRTHGVRLLIDGVDVTGAASVSPGRLHYDAGAGGPVDLESGSHEAQVEYVKRGGFGEREKVIGTYRWTFTVL